LHAPEQDVKLLVEWQNISLSGDAKRYVASIMGGGFPQNQGLNWM
jgi:hypothetical protein